MSDAQTLLDRYAAASDAWTNDCISDLSIWHRPDVAEFSELRRLLVPHAESGDVDCQYALANILWLGQCCESEQQFIEGHASASEEATRWWAAAAKQGYLPALNNLQVGVGAEAERVGVAWRKLAEECPDLVGSSDGMPVYGPEFFRELSRRLYGLAGHE